MESARIAVLIPAYNEEPVIASTIDALVQADCVRENIYVVDDLSTDRTASIASHCGVNVHTVARNGGKARAQNAALLHFSLLERYHWVIFLDGDTKVDSCFMLAMREAQCQYPGVALFVGQVKSVHNSHLFSAARACDYTYSHDVSKWGQSNFNVIYVSPGCCSMYRCDVLARLHIDHLTLAEDMDLTLQVHRLGETVLYVPAAGVNTQDPNTFSGFHKQTLRWYRGFWQVVLKHRIFGWQRKQAVDLYMALMVLDTFVFNRILWLAAIVFTHPRALPLMLALDMGCAGLVSLYCARRTRRWDVLYKFPVYYWLNYLNFYAYLRSFVEIVLLRKQLLAWNKVARYEFDESTSREDPR